MTFQAGDKVLWLHCPRADYQENVVAVVEKVNAKSVTILVARQLWGRYVMVSKRVRPETLRPRWGFCEPVDGHWEAR